jgi:KDO2-lipid IV(A) lauroyltransferase
MSLLAVRHALEYGALMAFFGCVRALPHRAARGVGAALGSLAHRLDARHRQVAMTNLAAALPDLDETARRRLVRDCYRHFGGMAFDRLSMTRFGAEEICRRVSLDGWEHLLAAEGEGRGVLLLTAHLGSWEMLGDPVSIYRGASYAIARPADNPHLDRQTRRLRERFGVVTVNRRGAGREAMRALKNGERVWILADQRVHPREGTEVPFLGRPAMTSTLAARLALRFDTPAVPIFCYPEPRGCFRIEVRPAIRPGEVAAGTSTDRVAALTARYVAATEAEIRDHPEMWLWMHDRWRQRRRQPQGGGG